MTDVWKKLSTVKISYMVSDYMLERSLELRKIRKSFVDRGIVKFKRQANDIYLYVNDILVTSKWLRVTNNFDWNQRVQTIFDTLIAIKKM